MHLFVRKLANELISPSNAVTWQKNERLKPEDSRDELINTLSSPDSIGLAYEAVMW